ncbi:hypothetical protein [Actinoalloteichus sp. AHMU CJ021]|uniref:hypothetical protein n=1 Tax=Actinoalloteichus sp. AHMU CJ021 TaxID=2072503 RepID=UPI00307B77D4
MGSSHISPEMALIRHLRARGFTIQEGRKPGDYVVTAHDDNELDLRPRLSLPGDLVVEYLETMNRTLGATPPGVDALPLVEVHLEEELSTAGADGRNHATAVGVRRGVDGRAEWFARHADLEDFWRRGGPSEDLEWRANPPK